MGAPLLMKMLIILLIITLAGCSKEDLSEKQLEELTYELTGQVSADSLESYVSWLQNMGTRFMLADNRRDVAVAIKERFIDFGYTGAKLDSFIVDRTFDDVRYVLWQYNVIARIEGNETPGNIYVMGGHYDSIVRDGEDPFEIAPGADDNASGVAATLEVARIFMEYDFIPSGTIEFVAFAAEELGLYGSWHYADKAREEDINILLMMNNDMIAYEPSDDPQDWVVTILNYPNSVPERVEAQEMADRFTCLNTYNEATYSDRTDSWPFSQNGYKALFFHNYAADPFYHTVGDLAEACNFEYCGEVTRINLALLVAKNHMISK